MGLKVLRFGEKIVGRDECGCGLPHDRTLEMAVIGRGTLNRLLDLLEELEVGGPFAVFYDPITEMVAGRRVAALLEGEGFSVNAPTFVEAEEKAAALSGFKAVIAVGGGTVIDVAKYAAYRRGVSFISFPTAPSHDGIASPTASLFDKSRRRSVRTRAPVLTVIDLEVISSAPSVLVASGFGDILAKTVSIKDWQLGRDERGEPYCATAERYTLKAVELAVSALSGAQGSERLEALAEALIYSGVAMMAAGSSRPASGSEHLFSHYLDMHSPKRAPHGIQCALGTLPTALYHETHNPNWWREYGWRRLKTLMERAGIPLSLQRLGIPTRLAAEALVKGPTIRPNRYTILHKRAPSIEEALSLINNVNIV